MLVMADFADLVIFKINSADISCRKILSASRLLFRLNLRAPGDGRGNVPQVSVMVTANFANSSIKVWTETDTCSEYIIFTITSSDGFNNFQYTLNDGTVIGNGAYDQQQTPSGSQGEPSMFYIRREKEDSTCETIAGIERQSNKLSLKINGKLGGVDKITGAFLIGKLAVMAAHDPYLTTGERKKDYARLVLVPELQPILNLSLSRLSFQKIGHAGRESQTNQVEYYQLYDEQHKPMYAYFLYKTSRSTNLQVMNLRTFQPDLIARDPLSGNFKVFTNNQTYVGYQLNNNALYDSQDSQMLTCDINNGVGVIRHHTKVLCHMSLFPKNQNGVLIEFLSQPTGVAMALLLPYICIVGAKNFNMERTAVPDVCSQDELLNLFKIRNTTPADYFSSHI